MYMYKNIHGEVKFFMTFFIKNIYKKVLEGRYGNRNILHHASMKTPDFQSKVPIKTHESVKTLGAHALDAQEKSQKTVYN